ncbi:unnamed protein product, partial [Phaeothamnion confervicola]
LDAGLVLDLAGNFHRHGDGCGKTGSGCGGAFSSPRSSRRGSGRGVCGGGACDPYFLLVLDVMVADELRALAQRLDCLPCDARRTRRDEAAAAVARWITAGNGPPPAGSIEAFLGRARDSGCGAGGNGMNGSRHGEGGHSNSRLARLAAEAIGIMRKIPAKWGRGAAERAGGSDFSPLAVRLSDAASEVLQRVMAAFFVASAASPAEAAVLVSSPLRLLAFARPSTPAGGRAPEAKDLKGSGAVPVATAAAVVVMAPAPVETEEVAARAGFRAAAGVMAASAASVRGAAAAGGTAANTDAVPEAVETTGCTLAPPSTAGSLPLFRSSACFEQWFSLMQLSDKLEWAAEH